MHEVIHIRRGHDAKQDFTASDRQRGIDRWRFHSGDGFIANTARAAGLPPLDPSDPTAQALGFVTDHTKVDAKANATYKPDQDCGNCAQYQGKAG